MKNKDILANNKDQEMINEIITKYSENKMIIKEISRFDLTKYICFFCIQPIRSAYIEFRERNGKNTSFYKIHPECLDSKIKKLKRN